MVDRIGHQCRDDPTVELGEAFGWRGVTCAGSLDDRHPLAMDELDHSHGSGQTQKQSGGDRVPLGLGIRLPIGKPRDGGHSTLTLQGKAKLERSRGFPMVNGYRLEVQP